MGSFKFSFVFIAIFMVVSQTHAFPQSSSEGGIVGILKTATEIAEIAIDILIDLANKIASLVSKERWSEFKTKVFDTTSKVLGKMADKAIADVNKIADKSGDAQSKKLAKCFSDSRDEIMAVPLEVLDSVVDCAKDDLITLVGSVDALVKDLTPLQGETKKVADKIKDCKDDASGLPCVAEVVVNLLTEVNKVPSVVEKDWPGFKNNVKAFVGTMTKCVQDVTPKYFDSASKVFTKIANCAK